MSSAIVDQIQHSAIIDDKMSLGLSQNIMQGCINLMTNKTIFFLHKGQFVSDSRSAIGLSHRIEILSISQSTESNYDIGVALRLHNVGDSKWLSSNVVEHGTVKLGVQLMIDGEVIDDSFLRIPLPRDVLPGDYLDINIEIPSSADKNLVSYRLDLVSENVCWFVHLGSQPVVIPAFQ